MKTNPIGVHFHRTQRQGTYAVHGEGHVDYGTVRWYGSHGWLSETPDGKYPPTPFVSRAGAAQWLRGQWLKARTGTDA